MGDTAMTGTKGGTMGGTKDGRSLPGERGRGLAAAALFAAVFGVVTIFAGGRVLLGVAEAVAQAGHYVTFVLWFNFCAGFLYVVAGIGFWLRRRWSVTLAIVIAAATVAVFAAFGIHALTGGAWETRTLVSMSARTLVWLALAWFVARRIPR